MKWKSRRSTRTATSVETAFQARVLLLHETAVHFLFRQGFLVEPAVIDDSVDVVEPFQDLVGQEQGVQGEETVRSSPSSLSRTLVIALMSSMVPTWVALSRAVATLW